MPHGPLGDRIPFEGVLNCWNDDHDLPDLLLAISRSGKTGRLHFSNPEGDKTLDLHGGKIVFAESSSQDDGLGQYLLRTGKISLMDYTRVSRLVQPGKRLGALLVEQNVLEPDALGPAVIGQVRAVILSLFRRTETWYRFKEEELEQKETITLDLAVPELILEGVQYVESWRRVSKGVGSLDSVYQTAGDHEPEWESSDLDGDVRELIDMLATPTSLQEICTNATLPDFEACRYLWAFRSLRWIDLVDESALADAATSMAAATEIEPPAPTPADTPTLPSIDPPPSPEDVPQPALAMEPPAAPPAAPPAIPESLIQTRVSVTPPRDVEPETPATPPPPPPKPVPEHLNQTQLAVDTLPPAPTEPPSPKPIPPSLQQTQIAVDAPRTTPTPTPAAPKTPTPAIPDELMHTQMFVDPPKETTPAPPSTGELMESILEGGDPATPKAPELSSPASPASPAPQAPQAPPNQAATQFFDGPSALPPMDDDLAAQAPPPPPEPAPASPAPSGFEALAMGGGGPSGPPSPADTPTEPSVQPPQDDGMASFSDLALPEDPVPTVEADVITAEPAPAPTPAFTPDEPLLPPSISTGPIERESLVPPRRRTETAPRKPEDK